MTWLMLAPAFGIPKEAVLESGPFDFYHLVGITARTHDGPALLDRLVAAGAFPVTDPNRSEITLA